MKREQALKRALTDEEQAIIYAEILNKTNIEAYKTLSDTYAKPDTKISSQKKMQQYYTSPELANYIINLSSIRKNNSKIDILEPTAGEGHIVQQILLLKKDFNISMCELDMKNRNILKIICDKTPSCQLLDERNFLLFTKPCNYDYIFMNPPFHIKVGTNALLKRDIWDFDFVKRAYAMLKVGGELVAIMSKHFTFAVDTPSVEFRNFLKTVEHVQEIRNDEKFTENVKLDIVVLKITKKNNELDNDILKTEFYNKSDLLNKIVTEIKDDTIDFNKKTISVMQKENDKMNNELQKLENEIDFVSKQKRKQNIKIIS